MQHCLWRAIRDIVMKVNSQQSIVERKRKQFKGMFGDKYSLILLDLQVWGNKEGRTLGEVSFIFGDKLKLPRKKVDF